MVAALEAVKLGEPILHAAWTHGVPRSTLQDRVHGKVTHGALPGPRPYLAPAEEKELSIFIVDVAKAGYGKLGSRSKPLQKMLLLRKGLFEARKCPMAGSTSSWIGILLSHYEKVMQQPMCEWTASILIQ